MELLRILDDYTFINMVYSRFISESKHSHGASYEIKNKAKRLRKNMTCTEKILWVHLRRRKLNDIPFRRQHAYGIYILDFYSFEANLVIEIDGESHINRKEYDEERTKYLNSTGLKVIRFTNEDILNRLEWVLNSIKAYTEEN